MKATTKQKTLQSASNTIDLKKLNLQFYWIDILRVIFALIILNFHCYKEYYSVVEGKAVGGGWLACDAFFILSGFFLGLSAFKDNSPSFFRFVFRKVYSLIFFITCAFLESIIVAAILKSTNLYPEDWLRPFKGGVAAMWFIWSLWFGEIVLYPILKYIKNEKIKISVISLLFAIGIAGYVIAQVTTGFETSVSQVTNGFYKFVYHQEAQFRSLLGLSSGIFIWYIYISMYKNGKPQLSSPVKTIFTIIGVLAAGACFYTMFWRYRSGWLFMTVGCFDIILLISFCKLGWISNLIKLPEKWAKFCRSYSLVLYLYHHAIATMFACMHTIFPNAITIQSISIGVSLGLSIPLYFGLTRADKWIKSKLVKLSSI